MVFGLFKKPADTISLWAHFSIMQSRCPGAAFLYANAFKIAFGYAQYPGVSPRQRKQLVEEYMQECMQTFAIDKGSRMLAVQSVLKIGDRSPAGWERFPTDNNIIAIAKSTAPHRDIDDSDSETPAVDQQRGFIEYVGTKTLKEFMDYTEANLPADLSDEERDFELAKTVAVFDVIAEWETGYLRNCLTVLDKWVKE